MPRNPDFAKPVPVNAVYLTTTQLLGRYGGLSMNWLKHKLAHDPDFPRPITLTAKRRGRWLFKISELEDYEKAAAIRSRSAA